MMDPSDDASTESHAPESLQAAIALLASAGSALETDRQRAKAFIDRASALVKRQYDRQPGLPAPALARGGLASWQAGKTTAYIDANLSAAIHMKDLADVARLSASHFCRAFKVTFGEPPFAYVSRRRIALSQKLMLESDDRLCEIALACGMCDQSHFTRVFQRVVGTNPNAWRRRHGLGGVH